MQQGGRWTCYKKKLAHILKMRFHISKVATPACSLSVMYTQSHAAIVRAQGSSSCVMTTLQGAGTCHPDALTSNTHFTGNKFVQVLALTLLELQGDVSVPH